MEHAARYFFYLERWGVPPQVVDEMPAWLTDRLVTVAAVHDEIAEDRRKQQEQASGG